MSTRNIHVNTASYTILVAGREKNTGVDDAHNGAAFRMLQGVIPQPVIMDRHGIILRTTGMMTVRHQTGGNTGGFRAHFCAVTVHGIEQYPCFVIIVIRFGCHKCPAVVQGVQIPDGQIIGAVGVSGLTGAQDAQVAKAAAAVLAK